MCHFITATLPHDADLKMSQEIFKRHHRAFDLIENESVREHLEKGDFYILTTKGMCDCGTILASQSPDDDLPDAATIQKYKDRAVNDLRAKGWSETKIRRWQKEQELNAERKKRDEEMSSEDSLTHADDWLNFIRDILVSKAAKRIGILVHQYKGGLDNRIKISGKQTVPSKNLTGEFLIEMREDVIYDFVL